MVEEERELFGLIKKNSPHELRLSYSRVSSFAKDGPRALVSRKDISSDGLDLGHMTDTLIFEPEKFNERYYIFDGAKPTASLGTLAEIILLNYTSMPDDDTILKLVKINNLWSRTKDEEKLRKNWDDESFRSYLAAMFESKGKEVIGSDLRVIAEELAAVLKTHQHSKHLLRDAYKHEDIYDQFELEFTYGKFVFRGIIDRLIINHADKTIQMIDLKTGSPHGLSFMKSFMDFNYYLQEAIYTLGVNHVREKLGLDEEYELLPFLFLYVGKGDQIPLVYEMTDTWHKAAKNGFTTRSGYKYKGLDELLDDIDWHLTNQKFDLPREVYEKEGSLTLKDDFIVANE